MGVPRENIHESKEKKTVADAKGEQRKVGREAKV